MQNMTPKTAVFIFFILGTLGTYAQQCGYYPFYVFAVNPHLFNSNKKIEGLKMYLVDENNQAITNTKDVLVKKSWQPIRDSFYFWDNSKKVKGDYTKPFIRRNFYRVGDHYLVAIHLETHLLKDPLAYPMYKLKVEEQIINNIQIREQYFYLPVKKAISICEHHLYSDFNGYPPVKTLDGKDFEPIDIVLDKEQQAEVAEEKNSLRYAVRFDYYELKESAEEGAKAYTVTGAKIFNTQTGKVQQVLNILSQSKAEIKESKRIIEFTDFYNRGIEEAKDFSVQIDNWRDLKNMVVREKTNFYIFNPSKKLYELDTALSNYDDVFYYLPLKKMRRYEYVITETSRIVNTYQFENKKWVLIDKNETLFKPVPPPIKYAPKNCILFADKSHTLPLQAVIGSNATKLVKDTFWLYNGCDETVFITKVHSFTRDFFSINQTLAPKQYTPLIFNGLLQNSSFDFTNPTFNCSLTLNDNAILQFGITVPTVSNNATVFYNKDSSVNYAIAQQKNKRYSNALFTYPNGNLRAKGYIQDGDTSLKVGKWQFYKEGVWGFEEVVYSKEISLTAFDTENGSQHINFKIKVLENGNWKQPIIDEDNNQKSFYITKETDSIVAFTDTTSYGFALPYNKIPANIAMQFFLLKPNERTMKIGYYRMPFSVLKNQYTIIPDYSKFKNKNQTTYQITDSIIAALQKQFPKIATIMVSKHQSGVNLQYLSYDDQYKVIMKLTNDSNIAFVCNLFTVMNKNRIAFCNNQVYAEININKPEEFKQAALALGFTDIRADIGSNRFGLTHASGKLIDNGFFEAFEKLTQHPLVLSAHFNSYHEPELDDDRIKH